MRSGRTALSAALSAVLILSTVPGAAAAQAVPFAGVVHPAQAAPFASAQAASPPRSCPLASPGVHRYAPGSGLTVALTFDDGPGRDTARIIKILTANHIPATFFNIGEHEASDPALVRAEVAAGFTFGDHTWDHQTLTLLSASEQATEMDHERTVHAAITGAYPCLLRPPGGSYNTATLVVAAQRHLALWNWSVDPEDWKAQGSDDPYWIDRIRTRAEAGLGLAHPVILMHNQVGGNPATVAALPSIIAFYKAHHYTFTDLFGNTGWPRVTGIGPHGGVVAGGTRVTLVGSNFRNVISVRFGSVYGRSIHVVSASKLTVIAPAHTAGVVDIRVFTDHGTSGTGLADHFNYARPAPPPPPSPTPTPTPPPSPTPTPTPTPTDTGTGTDVVTPASAATPAASPAASPAQLVHDASSGQVVVTALPNQASSPAPGRASVPSSAARSAAPRVASWAWIPADGPPISPSVLLGLS